MYVADLHWAKSRKPYRHCLGNFQQKLRHSCPRRKHLQYETDCYLYTVALNYLMQVDIARSLGDTDTVVFGYVDLTANYLFGMMHDIDQETVGALTRYGC